MVALKDKKQEKVFIRKEMFLFNNLPGLQQIYIISVLICIQL